MHIIIYGKPGCHFCARAKQLCSETLSGVATYAYIDIIDEGLTRDDLEAICGKEVRTVPQIFVDEHHVGGYVELTQHLSRDPVVG